MEPNRSWHDPVVEIYSNLITPGIRCAANGYDPANRRWYCLKVEAEIEDDHWLSSTITSHLREYYSTHQTPPPWNTISTNAERNQVTFECEPREMVDRPIQKSLCYGTQPENRLPTMSIESLTNLSYINRSADRCNWNGHNCVFKRIEFDVDIDVIKTEIQMRETLINAMNQIPTDQTSTEMARRFCLVPILAVLIGNRRPWKPDTVAGCLMPYAGKDLELLVRNSDTDLHLTITQLRDLVRGVRELSRLGVQHGDIKYWNTVLQPAGKDGGSDKLMLIDAGCEAPDYDGDARALATLLYWCLENISSLGQGDQAKTIVVAAASALADEDFDTALSCLLARK